MLVGIMLAKNLLHIGRFKSCALVQVIQSRNTKPNGQVPVPKGTGSGNEYHIILK
jgi:hypothetical protein